MRSVVWAFVASVAVLAVSVSGQQQPPRRTYAPGEVIVKYAQGATALQRNSLLAARSAARVRRFARIDAELLRLPANQTVEAAIAAFRAMPGVALVQPNYTRHTTQSAPPNDPFWLDGSMWNLSKIQADLAWSNFGAGDSNVVIANIDTGVDYTHPDLAANMWVNPVEIPDNGIDDDGNGYVDDVHGINTANHTSDPFDDQGHGTHTAGTAAAAGNNGEGITGVTWNSKILSCKFLDSTGYGTDAGAIECFDYVLMMKQRGVNIRVTSNSWGGTREGPVAEVLVAAIDAAGVAGIINVFGAGNDGMNNDVVPFDPASYDVPSIIAVASSGPTDRRSSFSNYGATSVDIAAPGQDILSTYPFGNYEYLSGTSMATPHVAGAAALLAGLNPSLTPLEIKQLLMDNVDQQTRWNGVVVSGGRLNVFKAASMVGNVTPNEPPTVSLTNPAEGQTFREPVTVSLAATAADTDGNIASVSFFANGSPLGLDTTSPYSLNWINAPPGVYTLTAVATDNLGKSTTSAPVHVTVEANPPPTVEITSPAEGAAFVSPATIGVTATAGDSDGVLQVAFLVNGDVKSVDSTAPYTFSWDAPIGSYTLEAVATDNLGAVSTSAPVHVTVTPLPGRINVALAGNGGSATASSVYNANYPASATINGDRKGLNWGAGGGWNDGTVNQYPDWIEVAFAGQKLIEEVNVFSMQDNYGSPVEPTPTQTFTLWGLRAFDVQYWDGTGWVTVPDGAVTANTLVWRQVVFVPLVTSKIRVHISAALNGNSRMMEVEAWGIRAGGNTAPEVSISSPAEGATATAPANFTINAAASDIDGTIQDVTFYVNGSPVGTDTTSPYSMPWTNAGVGSYTLTAVATDNEGAMTTSAPVHVTVTATNAPPSVSISSPAAGASFVAPATIPVSANAADSDGTVASVAFYASGALIGTDTTSPFSVSWPNVAAGSYSLTAVATDNSGATTTSAPVAITVTPPPNRTNVALAANGGVATASSTYSAAYSVAGTINGDRKGIGWGSGGGWNDATSNTYPDWVEVAFNGTKTIDEVSVFSMQDNYTSPVEPTATMTFTSWGLRAFEIQQWTGSSWLAIPGASITNNNLVWRKFTFSPVTTTKIRVNITSALNGFSRMIEVEAWGTNGSGGGNTPPTVSITNPAGGATFTSPATIAVDANASDADGSIQQVAFLANGSAIGTDMTAPFSVSWPNVSAGSYTITAVATDNLGATTTSAPVTITVNPPAGRMNMALASNGGVATVSSQYNANYGPAGTINGDRKGLGWGANGGWNDGTPNTYPDWLEVSFSSAKTIDEISVFSMQDNYTSPSDPTPTMTFASWGLKAFEIQYWTGSAWATVPAGAITNNNLVWRKVTFTPITTTKIRVFVTSALNGYSRMVEVEAWGIDGPPPVPGPDGQ